MSAAAATTWGIIPFADTVSLEGTSLSLLLIKEGVAQQPTKAVGKLIALQAALMHAAQQFHSTQR